MSRREIEPSVQEIRPGAKLTEPDADVRSGENKSFAPAHDLRLKDELLQFLEEAFGQPIMLAAPRPLSEEHRQRLVTAQEAVRAEMERLRASSSAEDVVLTFSNRIEAGVLYELDSDLRFLGLRSLDNLARELAERARLGGILCRGVGAKAQRSVDHKIENEPQPNAVEALKERQDRLLDEGIEETFPASDPVSVSHIYNRKA